MRLLAGLAVMLFAACWPWGQATASQTVSPETIRTAYHHTAWTSKDGAPDDIESIAQTPDGWLWLGASNGLYRFDGVNFENIDLRPADSTGTRDVVAVMTTADGDVWVSYNDGAVFVARQGDPKMSLELPGLTPRTQAFFLQQDGWGDVWATTNAGLFVRRDGKWIKPDRYPGFPADLLTDSVLDGGGNFWVASETGVSVMRKGAHRFESVPTNVRAGEDVDLFVGSDGRAWAFLKGAAFPLNTDIPMRPSQQMPKEAKHVVRAQDGSIWTTTCEPGLCRRKDNGATAPHLPEKDFDSDKFTQAQGMTSDLPIVIYEDKEGTVWVLTTGGLDSFRRNDFNVVQFPFPAINFKLAPSDDGSLWVATDANLPSGDEYLWHLAPTPVRIDGYREDTSSLFREENGDLLLSTRHHGMLRYARGKFEPADLPPTPPPENRRSLGLLRDDEGKLWSSFVSLSLYRLDGNSWNPNGGLPALPSIEPDSMLVAPDGKLWLGYDEDEVRIVSHGRVESIAAKDGLRIGIVNAILPGPTPLLGGELGVSMLIHGTWRSLHATDPQALKGVSGMARSSDGATWINSQAGAVRIEAKDLDRATSDPEFVTPVRVLADDDGLPGRGQPDSPSMSKTTDGKLWFAQEGGLAWINPLELRRNNLVPTIAIRSIATPTHSLTPDGPVTLPAKTTNIRIAYTALSMASPAKNRFKVRLDGVDTDWLEMGGRREVGYTNLGPGNYHFHVKGSNNDGVWNEAGMDFDFRIEPTFFQTGWFVALEALACLLVLYVLFRLQLRRATARERDRVEIRHAERERLARDLHDSFLQVLSFLLLRFDRIGQGMEPGERTRLKVDDALDQAEVALADGRDRVSALRDNVLHPTDIAGCLAVLGNELSKDYPTTCLVRVRGRPREVRADVADEICYIGKEALTNAFRHADASHIDVDIRYSWHRFSLIVRDNGKGLPATIERNNRREGHWGLVGMSERAKAIGARLRVRRHPDGGTEVNLRVPAARIFR